MRIYLAGPMTGYPQFNFPKFMRIADELRAKGHYVFNPAQRDIERHNGVDISKDNSTGCQEFAASQHQFSLRDALRDDLVFITQGADAIYCMDGWEYSSGVCSEWSTAKALKLKFFYEGQAVPNA